VLGPRRLAQRHVLVLVAAHEPDRGTGRALGDLGRELGGDAYEGVGEAEEAHSSALPALP
jgi:hypothetical protein